MATDPFDKYGVDEKPAPSKVKTFGKGAAQGITLGFGDELSAAGATLMDALYRNANDGSSIIDRFRPSNLKKEYIESRDNIRRDNSEAQQADPQAYLGGELIGNIGLAPLGGALGSGRAALAVGNLTNGKVGLVNRALASAPSRYALKNPVKTMIGGNALGGASAGYGNNENTDELLYDVGTGGALGAGIGSLAQLGGASAKKLYNSVVKPVIGRKSGDVLDRAAIKSQEIISASEEAAKNAVMPSNIGHIIDPVKHRAVQTEAYNKHIRTLIPEIGRKHGGELLDKDGVKTSFSALAGTDISPDDMTLIGRYTPADIQRGILESNFKRPVELQGNDANTEVLKKLALQAFENKGAAAGGAVGAGIGGLVGGGPGAMVGQAVGHGLGSLGTGSIAKKFMESGSEREARDALKYFGARPQGTKSLLSPYYDKDGKRILSGSLSKGINPMDTAPSGFIDPFMSVDDDVARIATKWNLNGKPVDDFTNYLDTGTTRQPMGKLGLIRSEPVMSPKSQTPVDPVKNRNVQNEVSSYVDEGDVPSGINMTPAQLKERASSLYGRNMAARTNAKRGFWRPQIDLQTPGGAATGVVGTLMREPSTDPFDKYGADDPYSKYGE